MKLLEKKVALVTGAASGIGKETALLFAKEGAKVLVSDIDADDGRKVVEQIKNNGGEASFFKADVSKPEEQEALVEAARKKYGALHIAFNNAGIVGPVGPVADIPIEEWDQVISINLSAIFYGMHYQIPAIIESGGGNIVNTASIMGQVAAANQSGYNSAKHGVVGLTKSAALEYSDKKVRINAVGPGYIDTPLLDFLDEEQKQHLVGLHPIGRLGKAEEIAELVLWLASEKSSFVTGGYYPADGGYLAQ
ncbi:SDR family oxidoreductase [Aliifodinibius sp. S!AR15-10]|uniref:SDR family NAD(P)-dependent oxidoreductase n=1 Tax=Aliifodinibius sp. S!AR15-10 TaxID=2950437 RepID=UPI00285C8905|nr:glucose 1-dehydrogenase [Aliifodinibius sp. S!AR15-10]MDR8390020.1 SDR family oxidoreductase [Aliifodinibius sp. S!AR15-10]